MSKVIHLEPSSLSSQSAKWLSSLKWILEIALSPECPTKRLATIFRKSSLTVSARLTLHSQPHFRYNCFQFQSDDLQKTWWCVIVYNMIKNSWNSVSPETLDYCWLEFQVDLLN